MKGLHQIIVALTLSVGFTQPSSAQQVLKGLVYDFESPSTAPLGIAAVKISVRSDSGTYIVGGTTDQDGRYQINLPGRASPPLILTFSRARYYDNPTVVQVRNLVGEQAPVGMTQSGRDNGYYRRVAENAVKETNQQAVRGYLAAIAALPEKDQMAVVATLNEQADKALLSQLEAVRRNRLLVSKLRHELQEGKFLGVFATEIQQDGRLLLYGAVTTDEERAALRARLASKFPTAEVRYEIEVAEEFAHVDPGSNSPEKRF